jgi:medium-chain acyl-[acyl-carrier-protein] hydrolase
VWAVRAPGRESRFPEAPLNTFDELQAAAVAGLQPVLDVPFAFFGHSLGGLLAFEVARARQRLGARPPAALIVAGTRAPDLPRAEPPISQLPDDNFIAALSSRYQGIPPAVLANRELLELCLPVLRADLRAVETYRCPPDRPLACPLIALGGVHDPLVTAHELAAWSRHTTAAFVQRRVPGDHFFLNHSTPAVLDLVREALRLAPRQSSR